MGEELFHADEWTEMTQLVVTVCSFAATPKIKKRK
jgi:hypothetical protein